MILLLDLWIKKTGIDKFLWYGSTNVRLFLKLNNHLIILAGPYDKRFLFQKDFYHLQ